MKKIMKNMMVLLVMALPVLFSGCAFLGVVPDVDEYIEESQERVADNEALKDYVDELEPLISAFYTEGRSLEEIKVKGNEIYLKIDLGEEPTPYATMKDLMVYEATRIAHGIMTYREYTVINELYRITIEFSGEKEVVLYKDQAIEENGVLDFTPEIILNAVKR